jgi:serine/threonine-protein kinase RsbW
MTLNSVPTPFEEVTMILRTSFEELDRVVDLAQEFFSRYTKDDELVHKIMLLTSEAVTNAIEHGNAFDESKSVVLEFKSNKSFLEVWVEDEGAGYIRAEVADPLSDDHLLAEGGRGIFLIEELADEVRYGNEGRRIGMMFGHP